MSITPTKDQQLAGLKSQSEMYQSIARAQATKIASLTAELEACRKENSELKKGNGFLKGYSDGIHLRLREAIKALEFYADQSTWDDKYFLHGHAKLARQTLEKLRGQG